MILKRTKEIRDYLNLRKKLRVMKYEIFKRFQLNNEL